MFQNVILNIVEKIRTYEQPEKPALSSRFPIIKKPIIFLRCAYRYINNLCNPKIHTTHSSLYFPCVIAKHKSLLMRKLGASSPHLQKQKIINLQQAIKKLDGIIIASNDIFSFWQVIGKPTYKKGFVDGMLLSKGEIIEGIGGGLCQLSNLLFWMFLHAPVEIIERHHHSMDVFPDSGRSLPFGSGATVFYNYIDLKIRNTSSQPLQIKIWLTDTHLKGAIVSPTASMQNYHITEQNHYFIKRKNTFFRYNELYRECSIDGNMIKREHITTNSAPVLYDVSDEYIAQNNFEVLDFTNL